MHADRTLALTGLPTGAMPRKRVTLVGGLPSSWLRKGARSKNTVHNTRYHCNFASCQHMSKTSDNNSLLTGAASQVVAWFEGSPHRRSARALPQPAQVRLEQGDRSVRALDHSPPALPCKGGSSPATVPRPL